MSIINQDMLNQLFSLNIFESLKGVDPILKGLITTFVMAIFSYFFENSFTTNIDYDRLYDTGMYVLGIKKNIISLSGQKETTFSSYNYTTSKHRCNFSDRFLAIMDVIMNKINNSKDIMELIETYDYGKNDSNQFNKYIVCQKKHFCLDKDKNIYVKVSVEKDENTCDKKSIAYEKYRFDIYSYASSLHTIMEFIEKHTKTYILNIEDERIYKRFCYTLLNLDKDNTLYDTWKEIEFKTTRSFNNMFFEDKKECLEMIDFYVNNKDWYYEKGVPYTLGFGLYGNPGTGKTSFIKAIAKKLNRHVVNISLKLIKTKQQLENIFYEDRYTYLNTNTKIKFDDKLIIFEDIDCIGDLVLNRKNMKLMKEEEAMKEEVVKKKDGVIDILSIQKVEDPITLDDLLNLLDGVRETPGRIIIITSNHYEKLDPALVRPGRIDKEIHMKNVSTNILQEFSLHYFNAKITKKDLVKIKEELYSPAEITNIYIKHRNSHKDFIKRLQQNKRIQCEYV